MEAIVLQPADRMTTAQCVIECCGYLRTIANQEYEGEDWQTAPKLRRQNLLTDFLCNLELSGEEFAELCGLIGFQLSKTTTAKLAKFTVIAYNWQSEASREATPDILAALDKCEGVTLIEQRGYRPQARTYDLLRFHIAAFWRCLVNELRSLCLGVGLVVYPKEIPAQATETPQISTETAETVNVSVEGENEPQAAKYKPYTTRAEIIALLESEHGIEYDAGEVVYLKDGCVAEDLSDEGEWRIYLDADSDKCIDVIAIQPPQSPEAPQTAECPADSNYRVCSHCGKHFHEGYFLGDEYACSEECAVALYGGDREQFEADLEMEETEPGTTECYWSVW